MKKLFIYIASLFLFSMVPSLYAQQSVTLTFKGTANIDSIKIYNLTNNTFGYFNTTSITLLTESSNGTIDVKSTEKPFLYPNPFKQEMTIEIPVQSSGQYAISISDLTGKIVLQSTFELEQGQHKFNFSAGKLGVYLLRVSSKSDLYSAKLICTGSSISVPTLNYSGAKQLSKTLTVKKAAVSSDRQLKVAANHKLEFTAYSNSKRKVLTDFLKVDKEYTVNFEDNIWEAIAKQPGLDSLHNYLYSFNQSILNTERSTPWDVNEFGEITYKDSVIENHNAILNRIGLLNNEDSCYIAILPTDSAWRKFYAKINPYYNYYYSPTLPNTIRTKLTADTLQRKYTAFSIVQDLVFSKSMQHAPTDSLTSTTSSIFRQPSYLFDGTIEHSASNGKYYVCDSLRYHDYDSWNKVIRIEAEQSTTRIQDPYSATYERNYIGIDTLAVSKNKYIEIVPLFTSMPASVTFTIPNTLSGKLNADKTKAAGASYNIYCVFLPATIKGVAKPAKVSFMLTYMDPTSISPKPNSSGIISYTYDNKGTNGVAAYYPISAFYPTKQLIAANVTFPYSEYGLNSPNVKIRVANNSKSSESATYTRDLLIDCIILEPVR